MKAPVVDLAARRKLAQALRWLASGRFTNMDYEAAFGNSRDPAIAEIDHLAGWPLYSDRHEHKIEPLDRNGKRLIARCVLFLRSDLPYEWDRCTGMGACFRSVLAGIGLRKPRAKRDPALWPFFRPDDLAKARCRVSVR